MIFDVLNERQGWGNQVTGGAAGAVQHVTSLADSGPGTLREALALPAPAWIVFDVDGDIVVQSTINPTSDKTVDGRGRNINVRSADHNTTGIQAVGVHNLIFLNFTMDDQYADWKEDSEGADGVNLRDCDGVWFHHMQFSRWRDGAIDMREKNTNVSVTWSRFYKVYQACNWTGDRLSAGYNVFEKCAARCIQVIGGKAHSYNNLISDWGKETVQCAKEGGQLLSEGNVFIPDGYNRVNNRKNGGKIRNEKHLLLKPVSFLGGDDKIDPTFASESRARAVVRKADKSLKSLLREQAGPLQMAVA